MSLSCPGHLQAVAELASDKLQGFPGGSDGKGSACNAQIQVQSLGQEDPLEKEMASHSSIPAWRSPWTQEPGGLQFMGMKTVGHN